MKSIARDAHLPSLVERLLDRREVLPRPARASLEQFVAGGGVRQLGGAWGTLALRHRPAAPSARAQLLGLGAGVAFLENEINTIRK